MTRESSCGQGRLLRLSWGLWGGGAVTPGAGGSGNVPAPPRPEQREEGCEAPARLRQVSGPRSALAAPAQTQHAVSSLLCLPGGRDGSLVPLLTPTLGRQA